MIESVTTPDGSTPIRTLPLSRSLPSKDLVLAACRTCVEPAHPLLLAARRLAELYERLPLTHRRRAEFHSERSSLVREIDSWVCAGSVRSLGAAALHTESLGMIINRVARFSVDAHACLTSGCPEPLRHGMWLRLGELALAYDDLVAELAVGRRKLPVLTASGFGQVPVKLGPGHDIVRGES